MGKRLNVAQLAQKRYTLVEGLSPHIREALGQIEDSFTAIIYGDSGNGKTNLLIQLLKEFKMLGNMLYISYEEAHGKTIQDLILRHSLHLELPHLRFSDGETMDELVAVLKRKGSPKVVVLDSWQFSNLSLDDYKALKKQFVFGKTGNKRKIFLFISHVNGRHPDGKSALEIKRDANIKIRVEGFMGIVETSRYGSNANIVIWEDRARQYWGKKYKKLIAPKALKLLKNGKNNSAVTKHHSAAPAVTPSIDTTQPALSNDGEVFWAQVPRLQPPLPTGNFYKNGEGCRGQEVLASSIHQSAAKKIKLQIEIPN